MHELAERLLKAIRKQEFVRAGDRVAVAVSGGADSVALLLLLSELRPELGIVLSVAHVNHKLRGAESDSDEQFVAALAAKLGLELFSRTAPVDRKRGAGIESAARRLRYDFFAELACKEHATRIATAHTLDDQAETVLLRMLRGTGIRGLAAIHSRLFLNNGDDEIARAEVVRPLLGFRRAELREYLTTRNQPWREDSSNQDAAFLRNRVRQRLLPAIVDGFGDAAIEHLAELAEIARAEEEWAASTLDSAPNAQHADKKPGAAPRRPEPPSISARGPALNVAALLALPLAAARRQVRAWIEVNAPEVAISFSLIEEILELAKGPSGKRLELPRGTSAQRANEKSARGKGSHPKSVRLGRRELVLEPNAGAAEGYEYELPLPGEISVPELATHIKAQLVDVTRVPEQERDRLLDPGRLGESIIIRNWRAGDRYFPAHTSSAKKVKELLGHRHATGAERKLWPVAVASGELVWMRGFPAPAAFRARSAKAIWIREVSL